MVQVLEGNPSFSSKLGEALGGGISRGMDRAANFAEQVAMQKHQMQQQMMLEALKGNASALEKQQGLEPARQAIQKLRLLTGEKGIGISSYLNPFQGMSPIRMKNRGEFQGTQAALMPLFKSMFPRGMTEKEFAYVNEHYIPQVHDSEAKIKGKLDALEDLLNQSSGIGFEGSPQISQQTQPKRDLSSFMMGK